MLLKNPLKSLRDGLASRVHNIMLDRFIKSSARAGFNVLDPADLRTAQQAYSCGAGLNTYRFLNFCMRPTAALASAAGGAVLALTSYVPSFTSSTKSVPTEITKDHVTTVMQPQTEIVSNPDHALATPQTFAYERAVPYLYYNNEHEQLENGIYVLNSGIFTAAPTGVATASFNGQMMQILFFKEKDLPAGVVSNPVPEYSVHNPTVEYSIIRVPGIEDKIYAYVLSPDIRTDIFSPGNFYIDSKIPLASRINYPVAIQTADGETMGLALDGSTIYRTSHITGSSCNGIPPNKLTVTQVDISDRSIIVPPGRTLPTDQEELTDVLKHTWPGEAMSDTCTGYPTMVAHQVPISTVGEAQIVRTVYAPVEQHTLHTHVVDRQEADLTEHFQFMPLRFALGVGAIAGAAAYFAWGKLCERYMASPRFRADLEDRLRLTVPHEC